MSATSYSSGKRTISHHEFSKSMGASSHGTSRSANPLDSFPTRSDLITSTFSRNKLPTISARKQENGLSFSGLFANNRSLDDVRTVDSGRWLCPDGIPDPNFGVSINSPGSKLSKSFRRIVSNTAFSKPSNNDSSLAKLSDNMPRNKKYCLVDESCLNELIQLNSLLKLEQRKVEQRCVEVCEEYQYSARNPLPATRYAIHSLCEEQMARARDSMMRLNTEWNLFCKQNHYDKPHLFIKDSYVNNAPSSQKALKLRLVRESISIWQLRKDRDTMQFEDSLSLYSCLYFDAQQRQRDYERYYILASRYGPMNEQEFQQDPRPGKRYFAKVAVGAFKFQQLWDRYHAMAKLRRFRACRLIQKYVRGRIIYKRLHPIIRLRLKIGKKTYYMFCFARWKEYNHLVHMIRDAFAFHLSSWKGRCFLDWKRYVNNKHVERSRVLANFSRFHQNAFLKICLKAWKRFVGNNLTLKRRLRRLFGFPHFDIWLENVRFIKFSRKIDAIVTRIQALVRCFVIRKVFLRKVMAQRRLAHFAEIPKARKRVQLIRDSQLLRDFEVWKPDEEQRRVIRKTEIERQRLQRRQLFVHDKERRALRELSVHLTTDDGQHQLTAHATSLLLEEHVPKPTFGYSAQQLRLRSQTIAKNLRSQCSHYTRSIESHAFDSKYPPPIRCMLGECSSTFVCNEQFAAHMSLSSVHSHEPEIVLRNSSLNIDLQLMIRNPKGFDALRDFCVNRFGLSGPTNLVDALQSLMDLRRNAANSSIFYTKVLNFCDIFLRDDAPRRCDIVFKEKERLFSELEFARESPSPHFPGYFDNSVLPPSFVRDVLRLPALTYTRWSIDKIIEPSLMDSIEYNCFVGLLSFFVHDNSFMQSKQYLSYRAMMLQEAVSNDRALFEDFKQHRLKAIASWSKDFKFHEMQISRKAMDVVEQMMEIESMRILAMVERISINETARDRSYQEQVVHEEIMLIEDEILCWVEENVLEHTFDLYVRKMLTAMLEIPEFRKGMLQYAGFTKSTMSKRSKIDDAQQGKGVDGKRWMDDFLSTL